MRKYLSTIHEKSDSHKKRFAFLVSGGITLFIFSVWTFVNFSTEPSVLADRNDSLSETEEVSPFGSWSGNMAAGWMSIRESFADLKSGIEGVNLESGYQDMKGRAFDAYGQ